MKNKTESFKSRNFSPEGIQRFNTALTNYNWTHVTGQTCAQLATNNFLATFESLFNTVINFLNEI